MAYIPEGNNVFGLTDKEILYDKITYARVKELIRKASKVISFMRSYNNYGEFRFITVVKKDREITFYGHGYHEYREIPSVEKWAFYESWLYPHDKDKLALNRRSVMRELEEEHSYYQMTYRGESESGTNLFSQIADIADDDGALSELEDLGLL